MEPREHVSALRVVSRSQGARRSWWNIPLPSVWAPEWDSEELVWVEKQKHAKCPGPWGWRSYGQSERNDRSYAKGWREKEQRIKKKQRVEMAPHVQRVFGVSSGAVGFTRFFFFLFHPLLLLLLLLHSVSRCIFLASLSVTFLVYCPLSVRSWLVQGALRPRLFFLFLIKG